MVKRIITEISEEDFRKLDLTVHCTEKIRDGRTTKVMMVPKKINDILDSELKYLMESGYQSDLKDLDIPVTIAIHELPTETDYLYAKKRFPNMDDDDLKSHLLFEFSYLDKFMNQFTGPQTYQIGWGIKHLYSTRDYYEDHEDYWRVRKDETKAIYRVVLSEEHKKKFVLKHKSEYKEWPYEELPEGVGNDFEVALLEIRYDLQDDNTWKEVGRSAIFKFEYSEHHVPVDINGKKIN